MPRGPRGEYRSSDPLKAGRQVVQIAVGDKTEAQVAEEVKRERARKARKRKSSDSRT